MNQKELLIEFETKYKSLYDIEINGVPVYTVHRNSVAKILEDGNVKKNTNYKKEKGRIYARRIIDSILKLVKFSDKKTLIFTSAVLRRDRGRNLAVEYLVDKYPDAVVFEWPCRVESYDNAYFSDPFRKVYCPLDFYVFLNKIIMIIDRKSYKKWYAECHKFVNSIFASSISELTENEKSAVRYLEKQIPISYASLRMSQKIFGKLFKRYSSAQYAIDFWGGGRENIIPILNKNIKVVELQHGIITNYHPGYIYPYFANRTCKTFFERKILVFGKATKELLCKNSIFNIRNIEVIGNPRIQRYKQYFPVKAEERKWILFTSQPYEQDGYGNAYYSTMIPVLQKISEFLKKAGEFSGFQLGIKLHPREDAGIKDIYEKKLQGCKIFDNSSQLFELLNQSYVHITATSTTLYEAALFDVPTITIAYNNVSMIDNYGFSTWQIDNQKDIRKIFNKLMDRKQYEEYLQYLIKETTNYM